MVKKITGNIKFSCKKPIEIIRSDAEKENIIKNWNDFIKNHVEDGIYNGKIYAVIDLIREKNKTIWVIAQTNFADYIYAKMTKKNMRSYIVCCIIYNYKRWVLWHYRE